MFRTLVCALAVAAAPAWALSCKRPDPVDAFERADADSAAWVVVKGRFVLEKARRAPGSDIPARFKGQALTQDGFTAAFAEAVTIQINCVAQWCGTVPGGQSYIAFLRRDPAGYTAISDACPTWLFPAPSPATERALTTCMRGACP